MIENDNDRIGRGGLDAEAEAASAKIFYRTLQRVRKHYATLLIGSRRSRKDPLDPTLDPVVASLVTEFEHYTIRRCENCGALAPTRVEARIPTPSNFNYPIVICAWGCDEKTGSDGQG